MPRWVSSFAPTHPSINQARRRGLAVGMGHGASGVACVDRAYRTRESAKSAETAAFSVVSGALASFCQNRAANQVYIILYRISA